LLSHSYLLSSTLTRLIEEVMSNASDDLAVTAPCATNELSLTELTAEICCMAGHINAASCRWLALIAELDRRRGWADDSAQSCAHWLGWKCGVALGAAREKVRVARALESLPRTSAAMASGQLSYSKVREITRVACAETEDFLLQIAEHGTAQHVESFVRAFRRCQQVEELSREARQRRNRALTHRYDDDGSLVIHARLPAEIGALFVQALEAAVAQLPAESDAPAGTSEPAPERRACRADALGRIAESFLAHGPCERVGADRHQVLVHVDAETLREGTAGRCELERGPSLAVETARRLACDASVVAVVEGASGEPLDVGRRTRTISTPLRRLLRARDRGCRFPGCANDRHVDAHHIQHWADGGETNPRIWCRCVAFTIGRCTRGAYGSGWATLREARRPGRGEHGLHAAARVVERAALEPREGTSMRTRPSLSGAARGSTTGSPSRCSCTSLQRWVAFRPERRRSDGFRLTR
jgi:hypothetical protein